MKISYLSKGIGTDKMMKGLAALNGSDVLVGITEDKNGRGKGIGNAALLFIHTNGSPVKGIPARPVIEPAIQQPDTANAIAKQLYYACLASLDGNEGEMAERLNRAGAIGERASKRWFTNPANDWAPNAPSTIKAKGSDTPLIDTGVLRRAITHVVELGSAASPDDSEGPDTGEELGHAAEEVAETGEEVAVGIAESAEILVAI